MAWRDEWPLGPDGKEYDGKRLMDMVHNNSSPFRACWDVQLLIQEVEEKLRTEVTDIPMVHKGSNNYVSVYTFSPAIMGKGLTHIAVCLGFPPEDFQQTRPIGTPGSW